MTTKKKVEPPAYAPHDPATIGQMRKEIADLSAKLKSLVRDHKELEAWTKKIDLINARHDDMSRSHKYISHQIDRLNERIGNIDPETLNNAKVIVKEAAISSENVRRILLNDAEFRRKIPALEEGQRLIMESLQALESKSPRDPLPKGDVHFVHMAEFLGKFLDLADRGGIPENGFREHVAAYLFDGGWAAQLPPAWQARIARLRGVAVPKNSS